MPLIAIYNPICGPSDAKPFFASHVLPLLAQHNLTPSCIVETTHAGHAGEALVEFLGSTTGSEEGGKVTVILGSGDGTLHEIINHLSRTAFKNLGDNGLLPRIVFVLVPCGTANALYASLFSPTTSTTTTDPEYRLQSVKSFVNNGKTIPLQIAIGTLSPAPTVMRKQPEFVISSVVMSTALHASILHDSEKLRAEMPGIERFKVAAQQNSTKWYLSSAKLLPSSQSGLVHIYSPATNSFVPHPDSTPSDPIVDLDGPFMYFLSTVNVDRLEPAFRIAPLAKKIPPAEGEAACEVVVVRPTRDPSVSVVLGVNVLDSSSYKEEREAFRDKIWGVMGSAYDDGKHVDLRYNTEGKIVSGGDGPTVVEYFRCGGWEWVPDDLDDSAHLLCSDGAISVIEKGGRAVCSVALPDNDSGFAVYT